MEELLGEGRPVAGLWYWGDVVGDTIIVEFDGNKAVITKPLIPDNLTPGQRIYRRTRMSVREAVKLPPSRDSCLPAKQSCRSRPLSSSYIAFQDQPDEQARAGRSMMAKPLLACASG